MLQLASHNIHFDWLKLVMWLATSNHSLFKNRVFTLLLNYFMRLAPEGPPASETDASTTNRFPKPNARVPFKKYATKKLNVESQIHSITVEQVERAHWALSPHNRLPQRWEWKLQKVERRVNLLLNDFVIGGLLFTRGRAHGALTTP